MLFKSATFHALTMMRLNVDMDQQYSLDMGESHQLNIYDMDDDTGYKNEVIELSDEQLLINIQKLQSQNNIKQSKSLVKDLGRCSLDIEMETGCVELTLQDGRKISIGCTGVEDALNVTMAQQTELDYLIYNDPLSYADLILNGDPEEYLKNAAGSHGLED